MNLAVSFIGFGLGCYDGNFIFSFMKSRPETVPLQLLPIHLSAVLGSFCAHASRYRIKYLPVLLYYTFPPTGVCGMPGVPATSRLCAHHGEPLAGPRLHRLQPAGGSQQVNLHMVSLTLNRIC